MKVKVLKPFMDKFDHSVSYDVGTELDWNDEARIADCEERGLIEVIPEVEKPKPKKKPAAKKSQ